MRVAAAMVFSLILPLAGIAAEEPETVYARFHRALHAGNVADLQRYGTPAGGAELAAAPPAQRKAMLEFMGKLIPKDYSVAGKEISPDGNTATLRVTARGDATSLGGTGTIYGSVVMLKQGGEWKVDKSNWGEPPHAGKASAPKPQAAAPAPKPQAVAPAPARRAPVVGSIDAAPEHKLGAAKPTCVYKPVMTNADIEACR